jgi:hypothetical protein
MDGRQAIMIPARVSTATGEIMQAGSNRVPEIPPTIVAAV